MSTYVDIQFALTAIVSQNCNRMILWNMERNNVLLRAEGSPAKLQQELSIAFGQIRGTFRCEVWKGRTDAARGGEARGVKSSETAHMEFLLGDRHGDNAAPMNGYRMQPLQQEEEEEEEDEEPETKSVITEAHVERILNIGERLLERFGVLPSQGIAGAPTAQTQPAKASDPPPPPKASDKQHMRELGAAIAHLQATQPETFNQYSQMLIHEYRTAMRNAQQQQQDGQGNK